MASTVKGPAIFLAQFVGDAAFFAGAGNRVGVRVG
jgi:hypothetical protein